MNNPCDASEIEAKVSRRIHDFDMISLLRLLFFLGYSPEEITFKSYNSQSSQAGLIREIRFQQEPLKNVTIVLNMGLLSAQSTLPSYFQKNIDKGFMDLQSFYLFIGYFDHSLIYEFFKSVYPELNLNRLVDLDKLKASYIQMLDLRSCVTLNWLLKLVFPELEVSISKCTLPKTVTMKPLKLGNTALGENAVFGNKTKISISGRKVTLFCDDELTPMGEPWPREIKKRLKNDIFPIFNNIGVGLTVTLVIKSQKQWVKLHPDSYLGYDKIRGGGDPFKQISIFKGYVGSS
jgi:hypothetical protein